MTDQSTIEERAAKLIADLDFSVEGDDREGVAFRAIRAAVEQERFLLALDLSQTPDANFNDACETLSNESAHAWASGYDKGVAFAINFIRSRTQQEGQATPEPTSEVNDGK